MMTSATLEVAAVLLAAILAAAAVAPWLATIFRIGSDSDANCEPETDGSWSRLLRGLESPLLRAAGVWPVREMTATEYAIAIRP